MRTLCNSRYTPLLWCKSQQLCRQHPKHWCCKLHSKTRKSQTMSTLAKEKARHQEVYKLEQHGNTLGTIQKYSPGCCRTRLAAVRQRALNVVGRFSRKASLNRSSQSASKLAPNSSICTCLFKAALLFALRCSMESMNCAIVTIDTCSNKHDPCSWHKTKTMTLEAALQLCCVTCKAVSVIEG